MGYPHLSVCFWSSLAPSNGPLSYNFSYKDFRLRISIIVRFMSCGYGIVCISSYVVTRGGPKPYNLTPCS